jgi:hypothetical protein
VNNAYVVTGMTYDGKNVTLDEKLPFGHAKVRVIVELVEEVVAKRPAAEVLAEIHERQRQRGFVPPTKDEVEARLRAERESWDD